MKRLIIIALCLFSSACSFESEGLDKLKELCEKDAGLTIYKTVKADGYYNAYSNSGITNALIKGPYSFYEFCNETPSLSRNAFFPEAGCFRVSKVKRDGNICYQRIDKRLSKFKVKPYPEFLKKYCIAVKKIEKPMARYSYHSGLKKWTAKNGVSEFMRSHILLKEVKTGNILSENISYSYNVKPGYSTAKSCEIFEGSYPSFTDAKFLNTVIHPIKGVNYD